MLYALALCIYAMLIPTSLPTSRCPRPKNQSPSHHRLLTTSSLIHHPSHKEFSQPNTDVKEATKVMEVFLVLLVLLLDRVNMSRAFLSADKKRTHQSVSLDAGRKKARHSSPPSKKLSHTIPALEGVVGAPPLPVLTTKDPRIIERWLEENVAAFISDDICSILGFDQESIAKPPWKPERASLPDGPATVQLSTPSSCIIIQLSRCGDGSALHAPAVLRDVINNERIIKVGVGIDDDALEFYRWSRESFEEETQLYDLKSRFDLGCLLPYKNPSTRAGIKELGEKVIGVSLNKSKRLSMSNWGSRYLTEEQIAYAARDAWVSAAIIERLQKANEEVFATDALRKMDFMTNQTKMKDMDERVRERKVLKDELKELKKVLKNKQKDDSNASENKRDAKRREELYGLLASLKGDQPPTFPKDVFKLPFY